MQRRTNLGNLILPNVVVVILTLLMVCVNAQAQIAFSSNRDGNYEIHVMDTDGGNLQNLTNHRGWDGSPSWSPDGNRIAFTSKRDGHAMGGHLTGDIYVMDADGRNQQNITNNPSYDTSPAWSPDGNRIAFSSNRDGRFNWEIYVIDADGGNLQRLTNNPDPNGHPDDRYPSWSPDGKRIVFSARRAWHVEHNLDTTYEIYVIDADGRNEQRLTENRNNELSPVWSPDGNRIAFSADRKGDFVSWDIYVMDADGGNEERLTNNRTFDWFPAWSPDGERIAFVSRRDGNSEIYVMDADGSNPQNLTNNRHGDSRPAWLNSPFSVSPVSKKFTMWGRFKQVNQ